MGFSSKTPIFKIRAPTQCFVRVEPLKINKKSRNNTLKINANLEWEKRCSTIAQKLDLGVSWASFGKGLGSSWASFGRSWALFGRSWGALGALLRLLKAKMSSKRPFGWILGCFGQVLGQFGEGLGTNLKGFGAAC